MLARDQRVQAPLKELEISFAEFDADDRDRFGPVLARAATPALGIDIALMKDEGYSFVAIYPPEGSKAVDIVGKAARWLTRRMTMDGDAPRSAMRRFLALAEEVEVDLPVASGDDRPPPPGARRRRTGAGPALRRARARPRRGGRGRARLPVLRLVRGRPQAAALSSAERRPDLAGVNGRRRTRAPVASKIAFATAAGIAVIAFSPEPSRARPRG